MTLVIRHHQPAAIPVNQLQLIRPFGAEHKDRPIKRFLAQMTLHQSGQPVMTLAEGDRITGHKIRTLWDGVITSQ